MQKLFLFVSFFLSATNCFANNSVLEREIAYLLKTVSHSNCKIERNGTQYTGSKALGHINSKYDHFKKEITSAEKFIALTCTKSEVSGKKYLIHCPEMKQQFLGEWMLKKLTAYRGNR